VGSQGFTMDQGWMDMMHGRDVLSKGLSKYHDVLFFHMNSVVYNLLLINVGLSYPFNKEMHVKSLFLTCINDVFDQDIQIYRSKNIIYDCILIFTVVNKHFST
jgi:hypothetical protein